MTAISWKHAVNGDWSTQADWNPASVPGSADAVTIAVNTAAYTVTVTSVEAAKTLTLSAPPSTLSELRTSHEQIGHSLRECATKRRVRIHMCPLTTYSSAKLLTPTAPRT